MYTLCMLSSSRQIGISTEGGDELFCLFIGLLNETL